MPFYCNSGIYYSPAFVFFFMFLTFSDGFWGLQFPKNFPGGSAPLAPRRGSAPGPRWGLRPQTPAAAHSAPLRATSFAQCATCSLRSQVTHVARARHFSKKNCRYQALYSFIQVWWSMWPQVAKSGSKYQNLNGKR